MAQVNVVIVQGFLGRDPELRYTATGTPVASLRIATTRKWKDKQDKLCEETTWHQVSVWGRRAEVANEFLKKGKPVYIRGRLRNREWTDDQNVKRYAVEIVADDLQLVERAPGSKQPHPADDDRGGPGGDYIPSLDDGPPPGDDDIPF